MLGQYKGTDEELLSMVTKYKLKLAIPKWVRKPEILLMVNYLFAYTIGII